MEVAAQQAILKSSLLRESQQQPIIDFGQFISPVKTTQEFFSNPVQFNELKGAPATINSLNQQQQFIPLNSPVEALRNLLLNQRNAQINYPLFQQIPLMGQNISIQHQTGTNFQLQSNVPQLRLATPTIDFQNLNYLNAPKTDIQTLLINNILAKNQLIQAQSMMQ